MPRCSKVPPKTLRKSKPWHPYASDILTHGNSATIRAALTTHLEALEIFCICGYQRAHQKQHLKVKKGKGGVTVRSKSVVQLSRVPAALYAEVYKMLQRAKSTRVWYPATQPFPREGGHASS